MRIPQIVFLLLLSFAASAQKELTLAQLSDGTFNKETIRSVNWMNDGQYYTALEENKIVRYNITTGEMDSVIFDGKVKELKINSYTFSADEKKLLIMTERKSIYRRSFTAKYFTYDIKEKEFNQLSKNGPQSYATFSPDGTMVAFVRDNNLFYVRLINMSEIQVTEDGAKNEIINGSTDWVYEEEFGITKGFFWSPDSKKIAYYRFDEREVKEYNMQLWNKASIYPEDYRFKYPKAGEKNAVIQVKIYEIKTNEHRRVDLGREKDIYIPRVQWTQSSNLLSIQRLNRLQNTLNIIHADDRLGGSTTVLTERSRKYIDLNYCDELIYLKDGKHFLMSSERQGYKHFYLHTMDGQTVSQVTSGKWEATQMVGLDESTSTPELYFISTATSHKDRTFHKVNVKGRGMKLLSPPTGWVSINMSKDFKYYIQNYAQPEVPDIVSLIEAKTNKELKVLIDNEKLKQNIQDYQLVQKHYLGIETIDKTLLEAYLLMPANLDSTASYPVLIFQYSGPGSQNVTHNWGGSNFIWHQYLTQQGFIVAVVDTRGTGARGEEFKKMTYRELGKYEVQDHIAAAKFLGNLPFVDKDNIGIWGWSYGGYMSSLAMLKGADFFKAGIAVAPVTTWRFYDTIYTERYLQRPDENEAGYDENSPLSHAEKLKGKFLLIHGTGDDNVHFQNSVALQEALINAGKQFDSFFYPDKAHGISGEAARAHLYQMMTNFLNTHLKN